jgi:hypothetical protein
MQGCTRRYSPRSHPYPLTDASNGVLTRLEPVAP